MGERERFAEAVRVTWVTDGAIDRLEPALAELAFLLSQSPPPQRGDACLHRLRSQIVVLSMKSFIF